eukprot:COSAG02_NODE_573_length_20153_cov_11.609305_7_plen_707_part_00
MPQVAGASEQSARAIAETLVGTVGNGSGEADPSVLACSMALLADATANERLKLAFQACDGADSGFVTVHRLSYFIKAFGGVLVAAVECILAATSAAMGATDPSAQMTLLRDTMPKMKATIASLSRSAKELWSPHGIGVADFQIWASSNHSVSVWVKRLAGVWAGPIMRLSVSAPRTPPDALAALKGAEPLLAPEKLTDLLSGVWPGSAASLRDRMFVMHAPEDGINLQKKEASVSLILLLQNLEPPAALEAIAEMQHQASDAEAPMEGVTIDSVVQAMSTLSREVADGLIVCCSLLVDGRPRGGVSRQQAFELLDPPLKEVGDRIAGAVVAEATDASSGEITPESFSKAVSTNADMVVWVEKLQSHWPSLAMLYSSTFCRALRVRHAARRGLPSAGGSGDSGSPRDKNVAASKIQALARGATYRTKIKTASKGAVTVQSFWRMLKAKKDVESIKQRQAKEDTWEKERRQRIERLHRNEAEMLAMKQVPANAVEMWSMSRRVDAIVAIQAAARSRAVRRTMPQRRLELQQANAARVLQKCIRRWMSAPKEAATLPTKIRRDGTTLPRPIAKMSAETIANWQNVIHNRRQRRPPLEPSELWAMRRNIQEKLYDRSLRRMEFQERNANRDRMLRTHVSVAPAFTSVFSSRPIFCGHNAGTIPAKTQLLMEAADLNDLRQDAEEWLHLFPAPPPSRLQNSRESHVAFRCA